METLLPELTPKHFRSRILKDMYLDWKEYKTHISESGLTAHYIALAAKKEGIGFILVYDDEFSCYRITRN